ncbi:MAG TPA: hypothetical protein VH120_07120 [Gemmataceae bacterium]|nr:hypothetical protein [Gemmataceae bacterium]
MEVPPMTPMSADETAQPQRLDAGRLVSAYEQYWHFVDSDDLADDGPACATLADAYGQFWQSADA